ncbi:2300_t:CDS:2 [Ambispora gerdemannii]|uniref:RBR-type E3 ubiquitin transferase n=1 Tax=Ambispora gerdemannii TaxID=144530 RepID=A0A9N9FIJ6_9GLOM|nr:2300_t:CDS:2 [Ambispora gerdemannii]
MFNNNHSRGNTEENNYYNDSDNFELPPPPYEAIYSAPNNYYTPSKTHTPSSSSSFSSSSTQIANRRPTNLSQTSIHLLSTRKECIVCTETVDETQFIRPTNNCTHANIICRDCISRHIEHEVQDNGNFEIRCPDENCRNVITEEGINRFSDEQVFKRYQKLSLVSALSQMSDFRWCSNPQCDSGQIHYEGDAAPIMTCQSCSQKSCVIHSRPIPVGSLNCPQCASLAEARELARDIVRHHISRRLKEFDITLTEEQQQFFESHFEPMIRDVASNLVEETEVYETGKERRRQQELEEQQKEQMKKLEEETKAFIAAITKMCPKCNAYIEKDGGCDHMMCRAPGCRYEFCWL